MLQVRRYLAARPELFATDAASVARNFEQQEACSLQSFSVQSQGHLTNSQSINALTVD